jgi:predicted cupin superfamily sugar epimerase
MANESNDKQADELIEILNLKPHQEGGFYSETYCSNDRCVLERFNKQNRSCSTAIYYLLKTPESPTSCFHRIKADEMWHFYKGLPLIIHELDEEKSSYTQYILNNELNVNSDARPQLLISYGKWFGAEIMTKNIEDKKDNYTLCGCTCTPGFDFNDFECAKRSYLIEKFPTYKELIIRLTPSE